MASAFVKCLTSLWYDHKIIFTMATKIKIKRVAIAHEKNNHELNAFLQRQGLIRTVNERTTKFQRQNGKWKLGWLTISMMAGWQNGTHRSSELLRKSTLLSGISNVSYGPIHSPCHTESFVIDQLLLRPEQFSLPVHWRAWETKKKKEMAHKLRPRGRSMARSWKKSHDKLFFLNWIKTKWWLIGK